MSTYFTYTKVNNIADMLSMDAVFAEYADDYDVPSVKAAFIALVQAVARGHVEDVTVCANGDVLVPLGSRDVALAINWAEVTEDTVEGLTYIMDAYHR
jgi:hypothetical protein